MKLSLKYLTTYRPHRVGALLLIIAMGLSTKITQGQASVQEPPAGNDDETVVMSPYLVDSSSDSRYGAMKTLAGSRLNSNLKDIPATIDVYTKDFMDDLGAIDMETVLAYANNYEQGDDTTAGNQSGTGTGNVTTAPLSYRVRGLPASRARNYFVYDYPLDTYNIERLDESRGPNAVLYGFGSPGGIVNSSTKKAQVNKSFVELAATAGNLIQGRFTADVNEVIIQNKLAVRLNTLHQEKEGWRTYTFDDRDALDAAVTYLPTSTTRIELEYETFANHDATSRPGTFWTQTSTWDAAGGPLINGNYASRNNATLNPGLDASVLAQVSGSTYWVYDDQSGTVSNWKGMSRASTANYTASDGHVYTNFGDFRTMQLAPDGILSVNVQGPSMPRKLDVGQFYASLQQQLGKNLNLELAATQQASNWSAYRIGAATLNADPNAYLPAGGKTSSGPAATPVANPNAGRYYIEGQDQYWITHEHTFNYRAALSYDLNLGKWFGNHRIGLLGEEDRTTMLQQQLAEHLLVNGQLTSTAANNGQNSLIRRHYILNPSNPSDYHYADTQVPGVPLDMTLSDGTHLSSEWYQYGSAPQDYTLDDKSFMMVVQSKWLDGLVDTVVGLRRDSVRLDDAGAYVADGHGAYMADPTGRTINTSKGKTKNLGIVVHPFNWLSIVANTSDSLGLPSYKTYYVPDGHFAEPTEGKGRDYGIRVSLPTHRISASLTRFQAWSKNEPGGTNVGSWGVNGPNGILDSLISAGLMTDAEAGPLRTYGGSDTLDEQSNGLEFALSGEILSGWDIRMNYSHTNRTTTNDLLRIEAWAVSTLRPFWASLDRTNPNDPGHGNILDTVYNGSSTIRDTINNFESNLVSRRIGDESVASLRPDKFNLFTTYQFHDGGLLRGLRVGGGFRYESPVIIGEDADGNLLHGFSHDSVDLMAAYTRVLFKRRWTLQMNINNAFHRHATYSPAVENTAGIGANTIVVYPPQEVIFTLRTKF